VNTNKQKAFSYCIIIFSVLALIFAYAVEFFGIVPCRLCKYQRVVYYVMTAFGIFMIPMINKNISERYLQSLEYIIYGIFAVGLGLGMFQVLVEHGIVKYESSCTASFSGVNSPEEFLESINSKDLVACDKPQLFVLGISLAGWNCIYMIFMLLICIFMRYKEISFIKKILEKNAEK
jgi:disulfide bond formation protein DsbB